MVPRQASRSNLAGPGIVLDDTVLCFLSFQALALLPFDQWPRRLRTLSRLDCFSFHRPTDGPTSGFHVQRVVGSDVPLFRQCSLGFLSCLSANGPTARPFGATLQAVNLSGLHSLTRVPFSSSDIVSASIPSSLAPFASLRSVAAPFVFS